MTNKLLMISYMKTSQQYQYLHYTLNVELHMYHYYMHTFYIYGYVRGNIKSNSHPVVSNSSIS